ncbi:MAG: hypothetical protein B6D56_05115 [Candidatus Omnitrophica bacterium 4484_70.1]|nr:MAG: hypothetical protein B6D56_05115 [Candidatus Omnitrophica bacterium 4484_70.1]
MKRKGFTLIEVLVAFTIMILGIIPILRIFFSSICTTQYINNRLEAQLYIEREKEEMQKRINQMNINEYEKSKVKKEKPFFYSDIHLKRLSEFNNLYKLNIAVSWKERKKKVVIRRTFYLRKRL